MQTDKECPRCHSHRLRKVGKKNNRQRYYCNDCKRHFIEGAVVLNKEPVHFKCSKCGGTLSKSGLTKKGKQRYKCRCCGYKQVETPEKPNYIRSAENIECPKCGSTKILKRGYTKDNRQRYECKDCGRTFAENLCYTHLSNKQKNFIVFYGIHLNVPVKQIAEELKCNEKTVRNIKNSYKNALLQKQIDDTKITFDKVDNKEVRFTKEQKIYIVEEMLNKDKNQKEIAEQLGCHAVTISRIKAWYKTYIKNKISNT